MKNEYLNLLNKLKKERVPGYLQMPTISTDIETAGTNKDTDSLIEFASVFDNGKLETKREDMPFVKYKVWHSSITGNPYAISKMSHNLEIIQEMASLTEHDILKLCCELDENGNVLRDFQGTPIAKKLHNYRTGWVTIEVLAQLLLEYFETCKVSFNDYYKIKGEKQQGITFQGKNFANFDFPFIVRTLNLANNKKMNKFLSHGIKHRILDVGSAWFDSFSYMPSLNDLNRVLDRAEVSHDALDDVFDCIFAVRTKLEYQLYLESLLDKENQ